MAGIAKRRSRHILCIDRENPVPSWIEAGILFFVRPVLSAVLRGFLAVRRETDRGFRCVESLVGLCRLLSRAWLGRDDVIAKNMLHVIPVLYCFMRFY